MTELKVRTRGGARAEGKPRVYFTCHPADFERSFGRICEDLFQAADCAVYYTEDMGDRLPEETREKIVSAFRMLETKKRDLPGKKHGNIPL